MTIVKDKRCIKYFVLAGVILLCLYSNIIADLFIPIFDDIYYGNLVDMFVAIVSAIIWGVEIGVIIFVCKKLGIELFTPKQVKGKEMQTWQVILLFVLTLLPMLIISACINWKVKIVYALGVRVTTVGLVCNVCEILAYAVRMVLMVMFIACIQKGFEMIFKTKYIIPYGAIFAFLTFGLIDFFALAMDLRAFYLIVSFLYGIIYLVADKMFSTTWILCYLIYLL
ncbi:MAG: hypothetical protein IJ358_04495 [Clostridia bacterium]|nr:hypothetical protein [Clostridia bacterium]